MGEAINLVNNFKVEKVIFNCGKFNDLEKELIKVLDKKNIKYYSCVKELNIDKNKLYFLQTKGYDNENDNSNVIYTEIDGYKFMFMGDAGADKEKDILEKYNISNIDVLKVGHHGSDTSTTYPFLREIMPEYAVISVGDGNSYGHPTDDTLSRLRDADVKVFRTDIQGDIYCTSDGKTVTMSASRNADADTLEAPSFVVEVTPPPTQQQEPQVQETPTPEVEEPTPTGITYILNTNSKKFHYSDCGSAGRISEKNKDVFTGTRDELIARGYSPCGNCDP